VRAQEPGTETPAPNTSLEPPLNPNSLPSLTLTGLLNVRVLQLLLMRQLLRLTRHNRCAGRGLRGDARNRLDVFRRRPAWRCTLSDRIATRPS
jgi:hypothetical protein